MNPPNVKEGVTGVYRIRNVLNGKVYIGSAGECLRQRFRQHLHLLKIGKHNSSHLQRAWRKYGKEAFRFEIVELCPPDECLARETCWIHWCRAVNREFGYNTAEIAGNCRGIKRSEEARARMTSAQRNVSDEVKVKRREHMRRVAEKNKGVPRPPEVMEKVRATQAVNRTVRNILGIPDPRRGRPLSPERKAKIGAANKGKTYRHKNPRSREFCADVAERHKKRRVTRAVLLLQSLERLGATPRLTKTQVEVLKLTAEGRSHDEVAALIGKTRTAVTVCLSTITAIVHRLEAAPKRQLTLFGD